MPTDLSQLNSAEPVKLAGVDPSTGAESFFAQTDSQGNQFARLKDSSGLDKGTRTNPIYTRDDSAVFSPLSSIKNTVRKVLAVDTAAYFTFAISVRTAFKEMHLGGRLACEGILGKYVAATKEFIPGGGFNSSGDVAMWTDTSLGDSLLVPWAFTAAQSTEGAGSVAKTFTKSSANHLPEITYNFSTPKNMTAWRYIKASVRVTVAAGGAQTRTVQLRIRSGTAIRIWQIAGTTTTAPFSTEQWQTITGELENPTAVAGTGTFDLSNVDAVSLRLVDGGDKTGTIYWDDAHLLGAINIVDKIYTPRQTTQLIFDPVVIFETTDVGILVMRNNDVSPSEFQLSASGVDIT
jgi:hypothetical protein